MICKIKKIFQLNIFRMKSIQIEHISIGIDLDFFVLILAQNQLVTTLIKKIINILSRRNEFKRQSSFFISLSNQRKKEIRINLESTRKLNKSKSKFKICLTSSFYNLLANRIFSISSQFRYIFEIVR